MEERLPILKIIKEVILMTMAFFTIALVSIDSSLFKDFINSIFSTYQIHP